MRLLYSPGAASAGAAAARRAAAQGKAVTARSVSWTPIPYGRPEAIALSITLVLVASGFHPLVTTSLTVPDLWMRRCFYLLQFGASALLLALVAHLGLRLVSALAETRSTNARLEAKVREATRDLEQSYARRMSLEREQAAAFVRERIYQDLHDDVGAKLLSLLYASAEPHQAAIAREALREIRSIASPERLEGGKACEVTADWRIEVETRCEQARFHLEWDERLDDVKLTGIQRYHLDRVLRELVSNALEHSGGRTMSSTVACRNGRLILIVEDDGCGFASSETPAGHGLAGIRRRVLKLGGKVRWERGKHGGVRCSAEIPLS